MADGRPGRTEGIHEKGPGRRSARHRLDMNPQREEAVENPNAIFSAINSRAKCARKEAVIPACTSRSDHTQLCVQSCRLYFRRGAGRVEPVQMSTRRIGLWSLDNSTLSLTILSRLAISEWLCTKYMVPREPGPGIMYLPI